MGKKIAKSIELKSMVVIRRFLLSYESKIKKNKNEISFTINYLFMRISLYLKIKGCVHILDLKFR